jgi:hypothetical protein
VEDDQPALIIRKGVFEPFNTAVNDKSDGRAHKSDANQVHNVGPKHEHFNFSFLSWVKIGLWKASNYFITHYSSTKKALPAY